LQQHCSRDYFEEKQLGNIAAEANQGKNSLKTMQRRPIREEMPRQQCLQDASA
jgi:hypothetical protein